MTNIQHVTDFNKILKSMFPEDVWDDTSLHTAGRFLKYLDEFFPKTELDFNFTTFKAAHAQMIMVRDIEFSSICCHHLLPFFGKVHIGYISNRIEVGVSKLPRLVDWCARRPHTQEKLTSQICHELKERLQAQGVYVIIESVHTCMSCRGVRKVGASMVTSLPQGQFLTSPPARAEFLELLRSGK